MDGASGARRAGHVARNRNSYLCFRTRPRIYFVFADSNLEESLEYESTAAKIYWTLRPERRRRAWLLLVIACVDKLENNIQPYAIET
ncbi:hypothetical protein EVAR_64625_1 [Eumeta japonica]|uniref:Uncharacterized protein n=1 Tax=Eumeta variegata TaxID=151549 RepID=A0A4C1ZAJ4_EUMVA|nr:hypothetical protein EVAR_64625_1 [Eumeta japonica]